MLRRWVLVHGPLSGPSFWSGVRDALWARNERAYLARLAAARYLQPPYWLTHAASVAAGLPEEDQVILVAHGGAGPLLPAIGRLARNRDHSATISGYVFVDSDLPRDGCSRFDLLDDPDAVLALRRRSVGGWMPRWTSRQIEALVPDRRQREILIGEQPETPLALYDEPITVPDDWPDAPCGYLELSDHCPAAAREASRLGWPSRRMAGHPFLPVSEPETVAGQLMDLAAALAHAPPPG